MDEHLNSDTHPTRSIYTASSIDEITETLAELKRHEAVVTSQLDALVASQNDLFRELGRLDLLRAHLSSQVVNTRAISNGMLSDAASTAHRISSAVKQLDQEQNNVKATLDVVEQVAELKACVLGVHGSMGAPQDWETAAGYLHRASNIPAEVIDGSFAEEIVPTAEVPDPPRVTLENAAESLCGLFLREFEKATKDADGARVTRFFKLFPLIGRSEVGLDAYGRYVCQGVAARARVNLNAGTGGNQSKDGYFYANALTKLFEHIAQIVDGHQPLVEQHYGTGRMVKVIERLQIEADVQGGIILDTWSEERTVDRKLTDIKSYPFSFLVQSFQPVQKPPTSIVRSESPVVRNGTSVGRDSEDDSVDMKEVGGLLGESAVMLGRWALYTRFLASKSANDPDSGIANGDHGLTMPEYLANSNLYKKISKLLVEPFNVVTTFFVRRSVEKAFQLDETPSGLTLNINKQLPTNTPYITSAVDDVMFIVNQVLQRSLATSQRSVVANVVPTVGRVLGTEFIGMMQRKLQDSYPKAAIQGALPPEDKIIQFLVLVNNLDVATDYIKRIVASHLEPPPSDTALNGAPKADHFKSIFPFSNDATFVVNALQNMESTFMTKCGDLLNEAITKVFFSQVINPRIRPILADAFRDVDYNISSDDLNDADAEDTADLVPTRFTTAWNQLTRPLRRVMTPRTWDKLLGVAIPYLARALEKRIWALHGRLSELGTTHLERDIAGIVSAACGDGKYGLRDSFQKCVQIVMVAGMESEEWDEISGAKGNSDGEEDGVSWVIDMELRIRARGLVKER
ncbi:COG4-domain-containing protein [Tothia fuscella]|uniref:Conserved oligomeric Golgi complex subunit 4 n=1 Tax=Tothia fuscella TaxID=1048955 RepID=A0A9P4TT66_9PEZI|nr:COG4-domain-containing protein [Tothia fuscella]